MNQVKKGIYLSLACVFILDVAVWLGIYFYKIPSEIATSKPRIIRIQLPIKPLPLSKKKENPKISKLEQFLMKHKKSLNKYSARASNRENRNSKPFHSLKKVLDEVGKEVDFFDDNAAQYSRKITTTPKAHIAKASKAKKKEQEKEYYFSGSSRINYLLSKRYTRHIPSPLYRCPGKGFVVINVWVNQSGEVEKASVNEKKSSTDQCLRDVAMESAQTTRFNSKYSAVPLEKGYISYKF